MSEFDVQFLILFVLASLVLWDKFLSAYENRNATKKMPSEKSA